MKTTYVYKSQREVKREEVKKQGVGERPLVDVYLTLRKQSASLGSREVQKDLSNIEDDITSMYEKKIQESKPKEVKKRSKLPIILSILLILIGAGSYFGYNYYQQSQIDEGFETLKTTISMLYTDEDKSGIISMTTEDLDVIYSSIADYKSKGKDVEQLYDEVDTIKQYLVDKKSIEAILDEGYNLADSDYQLVLQEVRNNVKYLYKVDGLASTINIKCDKAIEDYTNYINVRDILKTLTSGEEVTDEITAQVELVLHSLNKQELLSIIDLIYAEDAYEEALVAAEPLYAPIQELETEREGIKDSTKKKNKQRVAEIDELLAPMYEELEAAEAVVNETKVAYQNAQVALAEVQDLVYDTNTAEDLKKQFEEVEVIEESKEGTEEVSE